VRQAAQQSAFVQSPDLKSIKSAGHEMGDFFFVPLGKGTEAAADQFIRR
jgi:hypothetical protein